MVARKWITWMTALSMLLSLALMGAAQTVGYLAGGTNPTAHLSWTAHDVFTMPYNETWIDRALTVRLAGENEYPLISYEDERDVAHSSLWFLRPAVFSEASGCSGNPPGWICTFLATDVVPKSLSSMETYNFTDSFKVSWVFRRANRDFLSMYTWEFMHSLQPTTDEHHDPVDVVDFNYFPEDDPASNWQLVGTPSFKFDEFGNPHIAMILGKTGELDMLVYVHRVSGAATNPCLDPSGGVVHYQCDIVDRALFSPLYQTNHLGFPHLTLNSSNNPRIAYISDEAVLDDYNLKYAYPAAALLHPNCGPGGNTWRCIVIEQSGTDHPFEINGQDPLIDIAPDPTSNHAFIIYRINYNGSTKIRYAEYGGFSDKCGMDYALFSSEELPRWYCNSIDWIGTYTPTYYNFSLQVDSTGYPVIAANHPTPAGYYHTQLVYPVARIGGADPIAWTWQDIDGKDIDTGRMVSFDLGKNDSGALVYIEEREWEPTLRLATLSVSKNYQTLIRK